jgi:hypothetical protein
MISMLLFFPICGFLKVLSCFKGYIEKLFVYKRFYEESGRVPGTNYSKPPNFLSSKPPSSEQPIGD